MKLLFMGQFGGQSLQNEPTYQSGVKAKHTKINFEFFSGITSLGDFIPI
jgi:hypothetical protein